MDKLYPCLAAASEFGSAQNQTEDLPDNIWGVCDEFAVVFPRKPKGAPPKRMGHELKINIEPDTFPIQRSI